MIKLILSSFKEKKRYIISALLFLFSYLSLIMLLSVYNYHLYNINLLQNETINRGVEVIIDGESAKSVLNNNNIEIYYPIYNNQRMLYHGKSTNFNTTNNVTLTYGSDVKNNNEIIVSSFFAKSIGLDENNYKTELEFKYEEHEYSFIVVGITDDNNSDVYLEQEEFRKIFDIEANRFYVLIDKYSNVDSFINRMLNNGYIANLYNATNEEELNSLINLQKTYVGIMLIIVLLIFFFLFAIVKNMIQYESKNIAVLKAVGYRNAVILFILLLRLLIVNLFSYLLMLGAIIFTYWIANSIFLQFDLSLFNLINYSSLIMIVISFLIFISVFMYRKKIKKIDVIDVLQDYELL